MTRVSPGAADLLGEQIVYFTAEERAQLTLRERNARARHTSPLLPPNKPQRQREIPVTKIQLKQLICTDISSRALERCTAEPLLHCTTHTALLPHQEQQP